MSKIRNPSSYMNLPHVYALDSKFDLIDLGVYDPNYGIEFDLGYEPGQFENMFGAMNYDDRHLEGKQCVLFTIKHKFFGNGTFGRRMGRGHYHEKCFVSINDVNLYDVYSQSRNGNIIFFADIHKKPAASRDGGKFTLIELRPHLTTSELSRVKKNLSEIINWKEKTFSAEKQKEIALMNEFVADAHARAADSAVVQSKVTIDRLVGQLNSMIDTMVGISLSTANKFQNAIEKVEETMDLNIDWNSVNKGYVEQSISGGKDHYNFLSKLDEMKAGGVTETMKQYAVNSVIEMCGLNFVKNAVEHTETHGNAPKNITGMTMRLRDARDRGQISNSQMNDMITNANSSLERVFKENGGDMNSALETIYKESAFEQNKLAGVLNE